MWNRFLLNSGSFRAHFVGASLTLALPAVLTMSCSSSDSNGTPGSAGTGNSPGVGGAKGSAGAPATCAGTVCNGVCVDTKSSTANCGTCNNACPATAPFCSNAVCAATCANTTCGSACVDLKSDIGNCGACNMACGAGQACINSLCVGGGSAGAGSGGASGGTGTAGAGPTAGAGGSAGGGVVPAGRNGCAVKPGMISDFEEGAAAPAPVVIASEGRTGTWAIFNDMSKMTETIKVESSGGTAECDKFALHVAGSGYNEYVGFGMNFAGTDAAPVVYDGAAKKFTGIRFKAKLGTGADMKSPVRLNISIPATEDKANPGGACVATAATTTKAALPCYQHIGKFISPGAGADQLGTAFKSFTYCFDRDLYPLSLPSNVSNAQRDALPATLLKLQFQFNQGKDYSGSYQKAGYPSFALGLPFDLWVDDVEFVTGECTSTGAVPSPSNGSPAKPFPQNAAVGSCMPATNAAKFSSAIAQIYANWKKNFVQGKQIVAPEQSNAVTSEALGYGMMIAAAMGDKAQFDQFASYVDSQLVNRLMTWKNGGSGSASDADLDIAYAYLMANLQWPSGGYKAKSDDMAGAIASKDLNGSGVVTGGSQFASAPFNASYFSPAWMRKLAGLSGSIAANYTVVNADVNAPTGGIPTDWFDLQTNKPSGPGGAQVTSEIQDPGGAMGYDSARVPWRLGMDACLGGTDTAAVKAIASFFASKYDAGATIDLMKAGWIKSSGAVHPKAIDMQGSYIGPMGVAGMATGNTAMRDRAFRAMLDLLENGDYNHTYFPSTVGLLTLLAMSGNFPTP